MHVESIHKTMVAVFKEKGLSAEAAAAAKATQNLAAAQAKYDETCACALETPAPTARERLLGRAPAGEGGTGITSASSKVTSAEQVALCKVSAGPETKEFLMAKAGAVNAIALGAVARWARTLA